MTPGRIDLSNQTIIFETLKRRRKGVFRAVPVPPSLLDDISLVYGIREIQQRGRDRHMEGRLWRWHRATAWRKVTAVMIAAGIEDGPHRNPKRGSATATCRALRTSARILANIAILASNYRDRLKVAI